MKTYKFEVIPEISNIASELQENGKVSAKCFFETESAARARLFIDYDDDGFEHDWMVVASEFEDESAKKISVMYPYQFKEEFPIDFNGCAECIERAHIGNAGDYDEEYQTLYRTCDNSGFDQITFIQIENSEKDYVREIDPEDAIEWAEQYLPEENAASVKKRLEEK